MRVYLTVFLVTIFGSNSLVLGTDITLDKRPFLLVEDMDSSELKTALQACSNGPFKKSDWSIGHRGAPLQFPEHTKESYVAAATMGAGIIECDVTFTKDQQLVCRHSQNDLHRTTDILLNDLASTCVKPFRAARGNRKAQAECRTSDLTLDQFKSLRGKTDYANHNAKSVEDYMSNVTSLRTNLDTAWATLVSHKEYITLIDSLGGKFTPELKTPVIKMPFNATFTQSTFAQQLIDEYKSAGIEPERVFPQSFNLEDVIYWIKKEPNFGKQAIYLDGGYRIPGWSPVDPSTWRHSMTELKAMGVNTIAPPLWVLVAERDEKIVPSIYAEKAREANLDIVTWTVERSGSLDQGGGWYYQSIKNRIHTDGDVYKLLHALHKRVGVKGVFSDWPATTTYYANCFGLD